MRFLTLFLLPAACLLETVVAEQSSLHRHPRDVTARATTSSTRVSSASARSTTSKPSPEPTTSKPSAEPTTSKPSAEPASSKSSTKPPPTHTPSPSSKPSPKPTPEPSGLSQGAKIGLGVGIPCAVLAIVGVVAAYIIGKRRGRRRRVSDPTAGAGKFIRDPSDELNFLSASASPPGVAELPAAGDGVYDETDAGGHKRIRSTWWNSGAGRGGGAQKYGEVATSSPPKTPQELPA